MAQLASPVLLESDSIPTVSNCGDIPTVDRPAVAQTATDDAPEYRCQAGLAWCNGECEEEAGDLSPDDDPTYRYHRSDFDWLNFTTGDPDRAFETSISMSRTDEGGQIGDATIHLLAGPHHHEDLYMSPAEARQVAATLLNRADDLDPLPSTVQLVDAAHLRLGDDILTEDGWQTVRGLMLFSGPAQASVFTDERNDVDSDGWQWDLTTPVQIRRAGLGESTLHQLTKPTITAQGWCTRCHTERLITGARLVSASGVIRVRGRCHTCGKTKQNALIGTAPWAVTA